MVPVTPGLVLVNRGKNVTLQRTVLVRSVDVTVNEFTFVAIAFEQFVHAAPTAH